MLRPRYSVRFLLMAVTAISLLAAIIARDVARARAEAAAGDALNAAIRADVLAARPSANGSLYGLYLSPPPLARSRWQAAIYRLAGARGEIKSAEIAGQRSARVFAERAHAFRHLTWLTIAPARGPADEHGVITREQIEAASHS